MFSVVDNRNRELRVSSDIHESKRENDAIKYELQHPTNGEELLKLKFEVIDAKKSEILR